MPDSSRMNAAQLADRLSRDADFARGVTAWKVRPAREARHAPWPDGIAPVLRQALEQRGVSELYTHQAEAITQVLDGEDVCIVTGTASGKTLCYNVPVVQAILDDPQARALYLFPTKALAQDQLDELYSLIQVADADIKTFTYDGDTAAAARRKVRQAGHVVITNPDMLHQGILPHHTQWTRLFENLRFIVLDELHVYRGIFGSHLANVLRRLLRVAEFYGSRPQIVACSATIANPKQLADRLTDRDLRVVDDDGSPRGEKAPDLLQPARRKRAAGDSRLRDRRGGGNIEDPAGQRHPNAHIRPQPHGHRAAAQQAARRSAPGTRGGSRLSRWLSAGRASRDRAGPPRRHGAGRGGHQRPGTRRRHRRGPGGRALRLPGVAGELLAAGGPRRAPPRSVGGRLRGRVQPAGPVRGAQSGLRAAGVGRVGAHQPRQPLRLHQPPQVRRLRAAAHRKRGLRRFHDGRRAGDARRGGHSAQGRGSPIIGRPTTTPPST